MKENQEEKFLKYKDMLFRIAFSNLRNKSDAEDAVQETFFRYIKNDINFDDETYEKAWLIRVVINICYDILKSTWFKNTISIEEISIKNLKYFQKSYLEDDEMILYVMDLPVQYKNSLYLFYYEDYSINEIASILDLKESTVKTRLRRGRELIKRKIKGDD